MNMDTSLIRVFSAVPKASAIERLYMYCTEHNNGDYLSPALAAVTLDWGNYTKGHTIGHYRTWDTRLRIKSLAVHLA